ncbi:MAG: DUF4116 domain-containing protein [Bacteroidia bacterium]|nr:DUF4116 domain-containing protein [Bacteroidia bacterium]
MKTIHKIASNKKLLQIHFYQIYHNYKLGNMSFGLEIDEMNIEKIYRGFLETFDFTNVDIDFLFGQIRIDRRWTSDNFSCGHKDFYYFSDNELEINEDINLENFPFLFYKYKKSPFNDLISINYYGSIFLYNHDGELLNSWNANLYDDGYCNIDFKFSEGLLEIIIDDENNGDYREVFKYSKVDKTLKSLGNTDDETYPFEELDLLYKIIDRNIMLAAVENNGLNLQYAPDFIADKEIVLKAIKENAEAFIYCSETLSNDEEFIIEASKLNSKIMGLVNNNLIAKHKKLQDLHDEFKMNINDDDLPFCIKGMDLDNLPF